MVTFLIESKSTPSAYAVNLAWTSINVNINFEIIAAWVPESVVQEVQDHLYLHGIHHGGQTKEQVLQAHLTRKTSIST